MDYILTFSMDEGGEEVNASDRFLAWYVGRQDAPKHSGHDSWIYAPGIGFERKSDKDGTALSTQGFDTSRLYRVLSEYFAYVGSGKGYAAIAPTSPDASVSVVLVSNDPAVTPDPLGSENRGMVRRFQASAILTGEALFGSIHDRMFGLGKASEDDMPEEEPVESEARTLGHGPWIFGTLSASSDITDVEETALLIGGTDARVEEVLRRLLNLPEVTVYADDYFTYEDPANGARVMAQPFPTDAGLFTEIRLELPIERTAEQIRLSLVAQARSVGYGEIFIIQSYDDAKSLVQVAPLHADGSLGPMQVLKQQF